MALEAVVLSALWSAWGLPVRQWPKKKQDKLRSIYKSDLITWGEVGSWRRQKVTVPALCLSMAQGRVGMVRERVWRKSLENIQLINLMAPIQARLSMKLVLWFSSVLIANTGEKILFFFLIFYKSIQCQCSSSTLTSLSCLLKKRRKRGQWGHGLPHP